MKRHLALVLAACIATGASAQVVGYNFRSGDLWVDTQLGYISDYGRSDRSYFVDDLVNSFGAPGNSGKGPGNGGKAKDDHGGEQGPGNSGKDKGNGNGQGKGNKGKGHGH
jgi:hypothetical protein